MLTCCPHCETWFRVRAEHLSVANGAVTCGECERVFNALAHLVEEDATPAAPPVPTTAAAGEAPVNSQPEKSAANEPDAPVETRTQEDAAQTKGVSDTAGAAIAEAIETSDGATGALPSAAVPPRIEAELAALAGAQPHRFPLIWGAMALLLSALLLVQLAVIAHGRLVTRWPELSAAIGFACRHLPCLPPEQPQATPVRMIAREVREHPRHPAALLVNATLLNEGVEPVAFPEIELRLYDRAEALIGARRFEPQTYLDDSIPLVPGMPPGQPVFIVLELGGTAAAATSFEFKFL